MRRLRIVWAFGNYGGGALRIHGRPPPYIQLAEIRVNRR